MKYYVNTLRVAYYIILMFSHCVVSSFSATPWTVPYPALLSMGFPRQGYWSELSFPPPGGLPGPEIKPAYPAFAGGFFATETIREQVKPMLYINIINILYRMYALTYISNYIFY